MRRRCTGTTKKGDTCRGWALVGKDLCQHCEKRKPAKELAPMWLPGPVRREYWDRWERLGSFCVEAVGESRVLSIFTDGPDLLAVGGVLVRTEPVAGKYIPLSPESVQGFQGKQWGMVETFGVTRGDLNEEMLYLLMRALVSGRSVHCRTLQLLEETREKMQPLVLEIDGETAYGSAMAQLLRADPPWWPEPDPTPEEWEGTTPQGELLQPDDEGWEPEPLTDPEPEHGALHQQTSAEVRMVKQAIANGRTGVGYVYQDGPDGPVAVFRDPRKLSTHHVRIYPTIAMSERWGGDELTRRLRENIESWGFDGACLMAVTAAYLGESTFQNSNAIASGQVAPVVNLDIDQVLQSMGKMKGAGRERRNELRRWVRECLLAYARAHVVGQRRERIMIPGENTPLNTYQNQPLFHVLDEETTWLAGQLSLDDGGVPVRLRIVGGDLWRWFARCPKMRTYLGDLKALSALPIGQPGGQWAWAMGLASADEARMHPDGPLHMTRRELLLTYPPDRADLSDTKPGVVLGYWVKATRYLADAGWWAVDERGRPAVQEPPLTKKRFGWLDDWLDQQVIIQRGPQLIVPEHVITGHNNRMARREKSRRRPSRSLSAGARAA